MGISSRHAHGALATQRRREAGRRVELRHTLAVTEEPWPGEEGRGRAARREPPLAIDEDAVKN